MKNKPGAVKAVKPVQTQICNQDDRLIAIVFKPDGMVTMHRKNATPMDGLFAAELCKEFGMKAVREMQYPEEK